MYIEVIYICTYSVSIIHMIVCERRILFTALLYPGFFRVIIPLICFSFGPLAIAIGHSLNLECTIHVRHAHIHMHVYVPFLFLN